MDATTVWDEPYPLERLMDAKVPTAAYLWIDAECARYMLTRNIEPQRGLKDTNRSSSLKVLLRYAHAMLTGDWPATNQGVGFNIKGHVCDGAHRLKGLLKAAETDPDVRILILVCGGLPERAKRVVDTGRKRLKATFLQMEGEVDQNNLAAALRLLYCYDHVPWRSPGSWSNRIEFPEDLMFDMLEKHPGIRKCLTDAYHSQEFMKRPAAAVALYLARRDCPDAKPDEFMDRMVSGLGLLAGDPEYRLREAFRRTYRQDRAQRLEGVEMLGLWIAAFNARNKGVQFDEKRVKFTHSFPRLVPAVWPPKDPDDL